MTELQRKKLERNIRSYLIKREIYSSEKLNELLSVFDSCPYEKDHIWKKEKWDPFIFCYELTSDLSKKDKTVKADWYMLSRGKMWGGRHRRLQQYSRVRDAVYVVAAKLAKRMYVWDEMVVRLNDKWSKFADVGYDRKNGLSSLYFPDHENRKYGDKTEGLFCFVNVRLPEHTDKCQFCLSDLKILRPAVSKPGELYNVRDEYSFNGHGDKRELPDFVYSYGSTLICTNSLCVESRKFMRGNHDSMKIAKKLSVSINRPLRKYKSTDDPSIKLAIASAAMLDFEARVKIRQEKLTRDNEL